MANATPGPVKTIDGLHVWRFSIASYTDPTTCQLGMPRQIWSATAVSTGGFGLTPFTSLYDISSGVVTFNGGVNGFGVVFCIVTD